MVCPLLRRAKIVAGVLKKKECDSRAVAIVERLSEGKAEREFFRDAVRIRVKN